MYFRSSGDRKVLPNLLDPAICIYESDVRVFRECQNLPRPEYSVPIVLHTDIPAGMLTEIEPRALWNRLREQSAPIVVDVREPREFMRGHIAQAQNIPLNELLSRPLTLPHDRLISLACRAGRRKCRASCSGVRPGHLLDEILGSALRSARE